MLRPWVRNEDIPLSNLSLVSLSISLSGALKPVLHEGKLTVMESVIVSTFHDVWTALFWNLDLSAGSCTKNYCRGQSEQCIIDAFFSFTKEKDFVEKTLHTALYHVTGLKLPEEQWTKSLRCVAVITFHPSFTKVGGRCGTWDISDAVVRLCPLFCVTKKGNFSESSDFSGYEKIEECTQQCSAEIFQRLTL